MGRQRQAYRKHGSHIPGRLWRACGIWLYIRGAVFNRVPPRRFVLRRPCGAGGQGSRVEHRQPWPGPVGWNRSEAGPGAFRLARQDDRPYGRRGAGQGTDSRGQEIRLQIQAGRAHSHCGPQSPSDRRSDRGCHACKGQGRICRGRLECDLRA